VRICLSFVALVLVACSAGETPPAGPAPSASAAAGPEMAPTPYEAADIRKATKVGRRYEWTLEAPGEPKKRRVVLFTKVDDTHGEISAEDLDETGHSLGAPQKNQATWEEFRDHASFPKAAVTIKDETVTVPAGTYECKLYVVTKGDEVLRFWFAKTLPGPPVKVEIQKAGKLIEARALVRYLDH